MNARCGNGGESVTATGFQYHHLRLGEYQSIGRNRRTSGRGFPCIGSCCRDPAGVHRRQTGVVASTFGVQDLREGQLRDRRRSRVRCTQARGCQERGARLWHALTSITGSRRRRRPPLG